MYARLPAGLGSEAGLCASPRPGLGPTSPGALWSSLHRVGVRVLEIRSTSGGSARVEGGQRPAALLPAEGQPWGWPHALGGSWAGLGPRSNFLCLWTDGHLSCPQSLPCSVPLTSSEVLRYRRCWRGSADKPLMFVVLGLCKIGLHLVVQDPSRVSLFPKRAFFIWRTLNKGGN